MKLIEFRNHFFEALAPQYDQEEVTQFFYRLLEARQSMARVDLALAPETLLSPQDLEIWEQDLARLQQQEPVQYIIGETAFFGLRFKVNPSVLIPRPETEELVDWILKETPQSGNLKILDIGTGSGCIAISLAKNLPHSAVSAIDVSKQALQTAKGNATRNEVSVRFIEQDILAVQDLQETFDVIVSNPPYVRELEKVAIKDNVLSHEPHLALFVEDHDALLFYRKIAQLALRNLAEGGKLYFEINQYLGKETMDMLESLGFSSLELRKDLYQNHRMIAGGR